MACWKKDKKFLPSSVRKRLNAWHFFFFFCSDQSVSVANNLWKSQDKSSDKFQAVLSFLHEVRNKYLIGMFVEIQCFSLLGYVWVSSSKCDYLWIPEREREMSGWFQYSFSVVNSELVLIAPVIDAFSEEASCNAGNFFIALEFIVTK